MGGSCLVLAGVLPLGCAIPSDPILTDEVRVRAETIELVNLHEDLIASPETVEEAEAAEPERLERHAPPERIHLALPEVRRAALQNNLGLKVELYFPPIAREALAREEAKFEPSAFLRSAAGETDPHPEVAPGVPSSGTEGELGLRFPLRTGGSANLSLRTTGQNVDIPGVENIYDSSLDFFLTQPLLRDGGTAVNTASITTVELRQYQEEARTKGATIRILAGADSAYWRYFAAERVLEVRYEQYERALEQERQAQRLFEAGIVAAIEVTRAKAGVARRIESIILAENERRATQRELKRVMNLADLGMNTETAIITATEPIPVRLLVAADQLAENAVRDRMEILELELQAAIDAVSIDVAENQKLPILDVDYNFSYLGRGNTLADTLDSAFQRNFSDWRVGVTLDVPLGNAAAKAEYRRAVLQRALTLSRREDRAQSIEKEVYDSADNLNRAWQSILAARQEVLFGAATYEGETKLFNQGVRTSTDVLQALDFLADAHVRQIVALAGYETAKVDLAVATGNLLGYGHIQFKYGEPGLDSGPGGSPYRIEIEDLQASVGDAGAAELLPPSVHEKVSALVERYAPRSGEAEEEAALVEGETWPLPRDALGDPARRTAVPEPTLGPPAKPARMSGLRGESLAAGLRSADPSLYTVQVLSSGDEQAIRAFMEARDPAKGELAYFANDVDGRTRYSVVYGLFPTLSAARAAAQALPPGLPQASPWVRRVGDIQRSMVN